MCIPQRLRFPWEAKNVGPTNLSNALATMLGIPAKPGALRTRKWLRKQHELSVRQRQVNVRLAFRVHAPADINNRAVLLVDDVMTSGATLCSAAESLLHAGAREVWGVVAARGQAFLALRIPTPLSRIPRQKTPPIQLRKKEAALSQVESLSASGQSSPTPRIRIGTRAASSRGGKPNGLPMICATAASKSKWLSCKRRAMSKKAPFRRGVVLGSSPKKFSEHFCRAKSIWQFIASKTCRPIPLRGYRSRPFLHGKPFQMCCFRKRAATSPHCPKRGHRNGQHPPPSSATESSPRSQDHTHSRQHRDAFGEARYGRV